MYNENMCVMEMKATANFPEDSIEKIFQYPTSRFSKYCRGVLHTHKVTN